MGTAYFRRSASSRDVELHLHGTRSPARKTRIILLLMSRKYCEGLIKRNVKNGKGEMSFFNLFIRDFLFPIEIR